MNSKPVAPKVFLRTFAFVFCCLCGVSAAPADTAPLLRYDQSQPTQLGGDISIDATVGITAMTHAQCPDEGFEIGGDSTATECTFPQEGGVCSDLLQALPPLNLEARCIPSNLHVIDAIAQYSSVLEAIATPVSVSAHLAASQAVLSAASEDLCWEGAICDSGPLGPLDSTVAQSSVGADLNDGTIEIPFELTHAARADLSVEASLQPYNTDDNIDLELNFGWRLQGANCSGFGRDEELSPGQLYSYAATCQLEPASYTLELVIDTNHNAWAEAACHHGCESEETADVTINEWVDVNVNFIPICSPNPNPADLNGDAHVDAQDYLLFLPAWGECPNSSCCQADFNSDGVVDALDMLFFNSSWG